MARETRSAELTPAGNHSGGETQRECSAALGAIKSLLLAPPEESKKLLPRLGREGHLTLNQIDMIIWAQPNLRSAWARRRRLGPDDGDLAIIAFRAVAKLKVSATKAARYDWEDDEIRLAEQAIRRLERFVRVTRQKVDPWPGVLDKRQIEANHRRRSPSQAVGEIVELLTERFGPDFWRLKTLIAKAGWWRVQQRLVGRS